ncbi:UNVERIFIED_CONTAM: hypothetical protein PYX00_011048 [Menopon gallinae]|uniref:Cell division protein FtsA n=1 Tax=Menopon gallinae TaxID=328185 RepID=A0AAW2H6M5_9NEOP
MIIGVPSCITPVEKRAVKESALSAGAREVRVVEESLAAAIGADIPIFEPAGHMVCDIGGGTSEISIISLGGMVVSRAIRLGGDAFDESIIKYVRSVHNLIVGQQTAERLKIQIGNASPDKEIDKLEIKGTDAITGLPRRLEMDSVEVREALQDPINVIVEEVKRTLGVTPPELAADIVEREEAQEGSLLLQAEIARLKEQLGFYLKNSYNSIPAQIIAKEPFGTTGIFTISKGEKDGVAVKFPVVAYQEGTHALVGEIFSIAPLFRIQVLDHSIFHERSQNETQREHTILAQRGAIYDRHGKVLVENSSSFTLLLDLGELPKKKIDSLYEDMLTFLAENLKTTSQRLDERIEQALAKNEKQLILRENLSYAQLIPLAERQCHFPCLKWENTSYRHYKGAASTTHILGYSGKINQRELRLYYDRDYNFNSIIGKMGVELLYDEILRGTNGIEYVSVDVEGSRVAPSKMILPQLGCDLCLNIDERIQLLAQKALGERYGSVIVLRPVSGEVLALVSYPWYSSQSLAEAAIDVKEERYSFFNRAIQGNYPAASSFKLIMAAAVLQEKAFDPLKKVYCPGYLKVGDRVFHCHKLHGHGWLDLEGALRESCNVYFYTMGLEYLGLEKISKYAQLFGLGEETGIDLPNEGRGFIPSANWKKEKLASAWVGGDTLNLSIGQGYMTVTPLQMANVVAMIVNEGRVYQPQILRSFYNPNTKETKNFSPKVLREVRNISEATYKSLKSAMRAVVRDGALKWLMNTNVKIAGKTGTAEHWGYKDNASWFISYGPYDAKPEDQVVVVVMVEPRNKWEWWAPKASNLIYHGIFNHMTYEEVLKDLRPWYMNN